MLTKRHENSQKRSASPQCSRKRFYRTFVLSYLRFMCKDYPNRKHSVSSSHLMDSVDKVKRAPERATANLEADIYYHLAKGTAQWFAKDFHRANNSFLDIKKLSENILECCWRQCFHSTTVTHVQSLGTTLREQTRLLPGPQKSDDSTQKSYRQHTMRPTLRFPPTSAAERAESLVLGCPN